MFWFYLGLGVLLTVPQIEAPSFWYAPCAALIALGSPLWLRPSRGAAFTFPLILTLLVEVWSAHLWRWHDSQLLAICWLLALIAASIPIILRLRTSIRWTQMRWSCLSLLLIAISFAADRLFTNQVHVKHISAEWSADTHLPWGDAPLGENAKVPITLYQQQPGGYCYDSLYSEELKATLRNSHSTRADLAYNIFYDWGKPRSYNIGAVNGMVFNDGFKNIRAAVVEGGFVETDAKHPSNTCHE